MSFHDHVRYLDEAGRIMLPPDMIEDLGWEPGVALVLLPIPRNGTLIIERKQPVCVFCGRNYALWPYAGKHVCSDCRRALGRLL